MKLQPENWIKRYQIQVRVELFPGILEWRGLIADAKNTTLKSFDEGREYSLFSVKPFTQDFFGKSDPFLEFYKQTETGWQLAHRTEVRINTPSPFLLILDHTV